MRSVPDRDRAAAATFAIHKWGSAFAAIEDESETLVAGMAESVLVTTSRDAAERVYYMVTGAGLHVGQNGPKSGLFGRGKAVDYFLPREAIVGSDTDHQRVVDFHLADGNKVIIVFADVFSQFAHQELQRKPASMQAQTVATALGWPA